MRNGCPYKPKEVLEGRLQSGKNTSKKAMLLTTMFFFLAKRTCLLFKSFFLMLYLRNKFETQIIAQQYWVYLTLWPFWRKLCSTLRDPSSCKEKSLTAFHFVMPGPRADDSPYEFEWNHLTFFSYSTHLGGWVQALDCGTDGVPKLNFPRLKKRKNVL